MKMKMEASCMFINPYHRGHVYTGTLTMHTNISTHIGFMGEYVYDCHVKIHAGILRFYMGLLMKEEERRGGEEDKKMLGLNFGTVGRPHLD